MIRGLLIDRICPVLVALLLMCVQSCPARTVSLFDQGWQALVRDNDTLALRLFGEAYIRSVKEKDTVHKARALLYMGICSYGVRYSKGLDYANKALAVYKTLEQTRPAIALEGTSRCLLLVATIEARRGNYERSVQLNYASLKGFEGLEDTTGTVGLIYSNLGNAYLKRNKEDSAAYFFGLSLKEHLRSGNMAYLPGAYLQLARLETERRHKTAALELYRLSLQIADSTGNRQAQVSAWLGLGHWQQVFEQNAQAAEAAYVKAKVIAEHLTDKTYSLKANQSLLEYYKENGNYREALACEENINRIGDSLYSWDRQKEIKDIETRFHVAETERELALVRKEKEVTLLANYLLWGGIAVLAVLFATITWMFRKINKRDRLLLQAKDALVQAAEKQKIALEEKKQLKEKQLQQEIEFKESQLTAMTLQMMQKNELLQDLKIRMEEDKTVQGDQGITKIINKSLNQDKEWSDFNLYFESMNQHFYGRLKEAYPEISPNDLKICALIKLHLSIKEMATILNISPDSVKTARYRLRKKLQLNTEDNLTDFIMQL